MVLKNFGSAIGLGWYTGNMPLDYNGNGFSYPIGNYVDPTASGTGMRLYFGDGNTAPTKSDYWLSGNQVNLTYVSGNHSRRPSPAPNDGEMLSYVFVYRNDGNSDLVIKEVALGYTYQGFSSVYGPCIITRTVLSQPKTIQAGHQYAFTVTVKVQ